MKILINEKKKIFKFILIIIKAINYFFKKRSFYLKFISYIISKDIFVNILKSNRENLYYYVPLKKYKYLLNSVDYKRFEENNLFTNLYNQNYENIIFIGISWGEELNILNKICKKAFLFEKNNLSFKCLIENLKNFDQSKFFPYHLNINRHTNFNKILNGHKIDLIIIDTDGEEVEVLKSLQNIINENDLDIIVEYKPELIYSKSNRDFKVLDFYRKAGFKILHLDFQNNIFNNNQINELYKLKSFYKPRHDIKLIKTPGKNIIF